MKESVNAQHHARQACKNLIALAESTDREGVNTVCKETITFLCDTFGITAFGLLTKNSDSINN